MVTEPTADETVEEAVEHLMSEIARYLEVVEAFRAEGAEPSWIDDEALP